MGRLPISCFQTKNRQDIERLVGYLSVLKLKERYSFKDCMGKLSIDDLKLRFCKLCLEKDIYPNSTAEISSIARKIEHPRSIRSDIAYYVCKAEQDTKEKGPATKGGQQKDIARRQKPQNPFQKSKNKQQKRKKSEKTVDVDREPPKPMYRLPKFGAHSTSTKVYWKSISASPEFYPIRRGKFYSLSELKKMLYHKKGEEITADFFCDCCNGKCRSGYLFYAGWEEVLICFQCQMKLRFNEQFQIIYTPMGNKR